MKINPNETHTGGIIKVRANPDKKRFKAESGRKNYHREDSAKAHGRGRRAITA